MTKNGAFFPDLKVVDKKNHWCDAKITTAVNRVC